MPIRPENVDRYPADWLAIRARILARAGHRCEQCGVANHAWGWRDATGTFHEITAAEPYIVVPAGTDLGALHYIRIVLTIAHLNHTPEDCRDENLAAWCQRCHNRYDVASRRAGIRDRRADAVGQGDLLKGNS